MSYCPLNQHFSFCWEYFYRSFFFFFYSRMCVWLQPAAAASAGTMTGCASASLLTAPQPAHSPFCFISVCCSPPPPPPGPLETADRTFFFKKRKTHRHTQAWEEGVVDKGKDVLLFYIRDAFVCWGLTRLTGCQSLPFSTPTYLPLLCYPSSQEGFVLDRSRHSWIVIISAVAVQKFLRFFSLKPCKNVQMGWAWTGR